MDYPAILQKLNTYKEHSHACSPFALSSYEQAFEVQYTHDTTAIEGNTLTLMETKVVLEDGVSVGGKKLREIYEVVNHKAAFQFVKKQIAQSKPLEESIVKDIHEILMRNIFQGGIYRDFNVYISGAQHTPPAPYEMYQQIKDFYADLSWKQTALNPIEYAAWTHAEFVKIHPFPDGNGRTSRLIMNYQLMLAGFPPITISKEQRLTYFSFLEKYALQNDLAPFADFVADLLDQRLDHYMELLPQEQHEKTTLEERIAGAAQKAEALNSQISSSRNIDEHQR